MQKNASKITIGHLMNNKSSISIIIPVLNEAAHIQAVLQHLLTQCTTDGIAEIIVVDGGSTDNTREQVAAFNKDQPDATSNTLGNAPLNNIKVTLINSSKGRAKQMNAGAAIAMSNILYFLHADSFPPKQYDQFIFDEIDKWNLAGCFRMRFDSNHWWLRLASWFTQFSWRACRGGDQSQFITKRLFNEIGGFDESFIIYEDNDLINKLYALDEFVVINKMLTTSARRYQDKGTWKLQYHFLAIYVKKWFGASAAELHDYYNRKIA